MRYISTRGAQASATFSEILLEGLAADGGLFVPEIWPQITKEMLDDWRTMPYPRLAAKVLHLFAPEIDFETLFDLTTRAYTATAFAHGRSDSETTRIFPVRKLEDGLYLQELSNGPTLAFKDAAMQILGHLLAYMLETKDTHLTILGATSGDTGSAAIQALRGKDRIKVVMLSPAGRMSDFQRAQMYSVQDKNIVNVAVRGTFDDCQDLVKTLNADAVFKGKHHLGAVNSINWARVIAQTVYYISAYLQVTTTSDELVSFCVPSGNFGNAFAGLVAKLMGLPVKRIIVATNENDVLHRTLMTGVYAPAEKAEQTSSPSMDITKASNFERAVFLASGRNGALVKTMWEDLATKGKIDFVHDYPEVWETLQALGLSSCTSCHANRLAMIRLTHEKYGIFIDPHTADGMFACQAMREEGEKLVLLETAQAAKFAPTIQEALEATPPVPMAFEDLLNLPQKVQVLDANPDELRNLIEAFTS